jgi:hypothetical protein
MIRTTDYPSRIAWFSAMLATAIGIVGMLLELAGGRHVLGMPDWPAFVSLAVSASVFGALVAQRSRKNIRFASVAFVVNAAAISFALLVRDPYYAQAGDWLPFQANKLGCVLAALLAPQLWSALVGVGLHTASAGLVLASVDVELHQQIVFEPMGTVTFALVGVVLTLYRQRRLALERHVATVHAETVAAQQLARISLAVRDLANTPIQTLELCSAILQQRFPGAANILALQDRALARLTELGALLQRYEANLTWDHDATSLDAVAELERAALRP